MCTPHTLTPPSTLHMHIFTHVYRASEEEKKKYEEERAEELFRNMQRAKMVAKKRAEEMSKDVEVCVMCV